MAEKPFNPEDYTIPMPEFDADFLDVLKKPGGRSVYQKVGSPFRTNYNVPFEILMIPKGWNIRKDFSEIEELALDISQNGLQEPLEGDISRDGSIFYVLDGQRRYMALQLLIERGEAIETVTVNPYPATMTMQEKLIRMMSSSVQKKKYHDIEVADGILRLKSTSKLPNEEIAKIYGKSRQWVDLMIKLAKKPPEVKEAVRTRTVTKTSIVVAPPKNTDTEEIKTLITPSPQPGKELEPETKEEIKNFFGEDGVTDVLTQEEQDVEFLIKEMHKMLPIIKGLNDEAKADFDIVFTNCINKAFALKEHFEKAYNRKLKG